MTCYLLALLHTAATALLKSRIAGWRTTAIVDSTGMPPSVVLLVGSVLTLSATAIGKQLACTADSIPTPEYFGTEVTSVTAIEVHEFTDYPIMDFSLLSFERKSLDFCNVTVTYTHPGLGDNVNVYIWLPLEGWNGNFFAQGGGGFAAGVDSKPILFNI